jgi:hypothetical protein
MVAGYRVLKILLQAMSMALPFGSSTCVSAQTAVKSQTVPDWLMNVAGVLVATRADSTSPKV